MPINTQLGVKAESTWGTAVTVDRFFEYNSESIEPETGRVESTGMRSAGRTLRSDRSVPYVTGVAGSIELDVLSKSFGLLFKHMLGANSTAGPTDSAYTHTITEGSLLGLGLTVQVNRPFHPAGTSQAFTWEGMSVEGWELSIEKGGLLKLTLDFLGEAEATGTALASAAYASGTVEVFPWTLAALTIGGVAVAFESFKVSCKNGLNGDRLKLRTSAQRQEPTEKEYRDYSWEGVVDFESLTQYNRIVATTSATNYSPIILTCTSPTLIGATAYPKVLLTIPAPRFDQGIPTVGGTDELQQTLGGKVMYDGTNSPVTLAYTTLDSAA